MIRAVVFDLDGTLLDRDASLALFLTQQYDRFSGALAGVDREAYMRMTAELDAHGHVAKPEVYRQLHERLGLTTGIETMLLADYEANFHSVAIPLPGMAGLLRCLAAEGFRMGLVTNGAAQSQRPKIAALGIADFFESIIVSGERGIRKPEPAIFQLALHELGAVAGEAVFVGDHPEADIDGASRVGLRTIWKRNPFWGVLSECTAKIDDLCEIPALLRAWNTELQQSPISTE